VNDSVGAFNIPEVVNIDQETRMKNANGNNLPTNVSPEDLNAVSYSTFEQWFRVNRGTLCVQPWLMIIFKALQARTIDQFQFWGCIHFTESIDLATLASFLESLTPLDSHQSSREIHVARAELYKQISSHAVMRALTEPLECEYQMLLDDKSDFHLSLVDDTKLSQKFDNLSVVWRFIAVQVPPVLEKLFHSWKPSRQLAFVKLFTQDQPNYDKSYLLAGAILANLEDYQHTVTHRHRDAVAFEDEAVDELLTRIKRYQMHKTILSAPLNPKFQHPLAAAPDEATPITEPISEQSSKSAKAISRKFRDLFRK